MITEFKTFEGKRIPLGSHKYQLGDFILIPNPLKNSYTKITEVRGNSSFADYMITTYDIVTDNVLEHFPVDENEIVRKLTPEEIKDIEVKKSSTKYNL